MDPATTKRFVFYTDMKNDKRNMPDSLCYAVQGLTDAQSSDITRMGFGSIKSFSIHNIPAGLGYWLLVNYDHKTNELNVGNCVIKITRSKVHDVLGVPMGNVAVSEQRCLRKKDNIRVEWRKQFCNQNITVKHVTEKLKSYKGGGMLFKVNFLVLFNSIMGETTKSGSTVNHKFLGSINNEGDIPNKDWCSYIITCLKRTREGWNGKEPYNGPLTVLAMLYAHEQQLRRSPEKAITPAVQYVTTDFLVDLESSTYDKGRCPNDDAEEDKQTTQNVEAKVQLETHIESAEGQTDEVQATVDQNVNIPIGPPGAQSLSGLAASISHCNRHESPKDVKVLNDDDDDVVILEPKQEHCELVERLTSSQSGKVCVRGYTVNRKVAKTLEAILKEHGDIAAKCVFKTDSFRSQILEAVCEFAQRIQTHDFNGKLEEIERRVLDVKAANIDVSWLEAHLKAFRKREARVKYNLLMEMRANTLSAIKTAEINLRKRRAEFAAVQERSKEAKKRVEVVHLVGRNLTDSFFECRAKTDSWVKAAVV